MRNKCNIVKDLLPLYVESMVSADTKAFVAEHLNECAECRAECRGMKTSIGETFSVKQPSDIEFENTMKRVNGKLRIYCVFPLLCLLVFGVAFSWDQLLVNFAFMPLIGVFGYLVFRKKAFWILPLVVVVSFLVFDSFITPHDPIVKAGISLFYAAFIALGVALSWLLHYAFAAEHGGLKKLTLRFTSIACAVLLCHIAVCGAGLYLGTPLGYFMAWAQTNKLIKLEHADENLQIWHLQYYYNYNGTGEYIIYVRDPERKSSTEFTAKVDNRGRYCGNDYEERVANRENVVKDLNAAYQDAVGTFLYGASNAFPYEISLGYTTKLKFDFQDGETRHTQSLTRSELRLDTEYSLYRLGMTNGYLHVKVYGEKYSAARAAEIVLDLKTRADEYGLTFYRLDFEMYTTSDNLEAVFSIYSADVYSETLEEYIRNNCRQS